MEKIKKIAVFVYQNFGPLVAFAMANRVWGLKAAIMVSVGVTVAEIVHYRVAKKELSQFFKFSAAIAVLFGALDLYLDNAFFFKIEATITNLMTAFFFGITLFQDKPLIQQFTEQQGRTSTETSDDKTFFFQFLTLIWTLYFIAKAIIYLWINFNTTTEDALILRMLVGNASFAVMLFISIGLSRPLWNVMQKWKLLPSARV